MDNPLKFVTHGSVMPDLQSTDWLVPVYTTG